MAPQREDDLAWELVEYYRDLLTAEQRTAAFVNLGVGDYLAVIRDVLNTVATESKALSDHVAFRVLAWIDCYDTGAEFGELFARAAATQGPTRW